MRITFLGTNGWYDSNTGNTPCVLLENEDSYIFFDAGFGLQKAQKYITKDKPVYLFLSHLHIDHICGLHVLPKFNFKQGLTIFLQKGMKKYLERFLDHPYAMPLDELDFKVGVVELKEGVYKKPFEFEVRKLQHIDPTIGYRLNLSGKIISYCSDTAICDNDLKLADNADLLMHESAFRTIKKDNKWGHSSPVEAAELAKKANAKKLALIHFGPNSFPAAEDRKKAEQEAKQVFSNTIAASDEFEIEL